MTDMTEQVELYINGDVSGFLLHAVNHNDDGEPETLLKDITNWNDYTGKTIQTAPKGIGFGSYIISTSAAERELSVIIQTTRTTQELRAFRRALTHAMLIDDDVTLDVVTYYSNGDEDNESITGRIKGVAGPQSGENALLTITVLCTDPEKTTTLTRTVEGVTTTTTTKEL
jgi:hypothetical protein